MKRVPNGKANREKNLDFQERIQKKHGWIPSPSKYNLTIDWTKEGSKNSGKFLKSEKITFSDAMIRYTKKFDGPSPASYGPEAWKKKAEFRKAVGTYTIKDQRITFTDQAANISPLVPASNKYDNIPLDKFKEDKEKSARIH